MVTKISNKEAYEKLDNTLCLNCQSIKFNIDKEENIDCKDVYEMLKCLEIVKKRLEALEIIKEKQIDTNWFKCCNSSKDYNNSVPSYKQITREEYGLLREALVDDK